MGYARQYFSDGNILAATHLNHIEEGIEAVSGRADKLAEDVAAVQEKIKGSTGDVFALVTSNGTFSGTNYATLLKEWNASKNLVLYRYNSDGGIRYYHCMGTTKRNSLNCLAFHFAMGREYESIWVASDNSVTIESGTVGGGTN